MANVRYYTSAKKGRIFGQSLYTISSVQKEDLGTIRSLSDGREFIYAKAGATDLDVGVLCQAPTVVANHLNIAVASAAAIGSLQVTVTLGATSVAANAYAEGFLHVNDNAGQGYTYKIRSHPAASASSSLTLTLYDAIRYALTTSSEVTLVKHPCNGVVIHPSPPTQALVGVTIMPVTAGYYAWFQRKGPCAVLTQGTIVAGDHVMASATVDGAVAAVGAYTEQVVGRVLSVNDDTDHSLIDLCL